MDQTFDFSALDTSAQNVFGIDNPEACRCGIVDYTLSHYTMTIRIANPGVDSNDARNEYLIFDTVLYFSGPLNWQGADFRVAPMDEYVNLRRRIQEPHLEGALDTQDWSDDYLRSFPGRLLYVDAPNVRIQIMVHGATLSPHPLRPIYLGS